MRRLLYASVPAFRRLCFIKHPAFEPRKHHEIKGFFHTNVVACGGYHVPNQTDDRFSDLDRAFPVREVANAFEQEPVISLGKKPLKALRLFWVIAIVGPALNHESGGPAEASVHLP
jgi:hypothetical protein